MQCKTVRIKVEPCEGNPAGEVDINAEDFKEGMLTVEAYEAGCKARAEASLKTHVAETCSSEPVDPRAEESSPKPEPEAPKHETRIVEAEGKAEGQSQKKRK
jgi:hypothetical protein